MDALPPLRYDPNTEAWFISGYEIARDVLQDSRNFSSEGAPSGLPWPNGAPACARNLPILISLDPPDHTVVRRCLVAVLENARHRQTAAVLTSHAERLVARFEASGRCDIVGSFVQPLTRRALNDALSMRGDGAAILDRATAAWLEWRRSESDSGRDSDLLEEFVVVVADALAGDRSNPFSDAAGAFSRAGGKDPMTLAGVLITLALGGRLTVTRLIGNLFGAVGLQSTAYDSSRRMTRRLVEETLRLYPPTTLAFRTARTSVRIGRTTIPQGARLWIDLACANRDPAVYPRALTIDPLRERVGTHLAFGRGIHACPGALLARTEALCAAEVVARRLRNFRRDPTGIAREETNVGASGFTQLETCWEPR